MHGTITHLFLKTEHGKPTVPVAEAALESGKGIIGDLSFGTKKRQVLVIDQETLDEFGLAPGQVRENVTVSSFPTSGLATGTLFRMGQVQLEVTGDCAPCQFIEDIRPGLREAIEQRRGVLCVVVEGGHLKVGDAVWLSQV